MNYDLLLGNGHVQIAVMSLIGILMPELIF
jgi:hypothetical protein